MPEIHATDRSRFVILDNSIVALGGHFLSYALAVLGACRSRGYDPALIVHRSFRDDVPEAVQVQRLYRYDNWPLAARAPLVRWLRLNMLKGGDAGVLKAASERAAHPGILGRLRSHYDELDLRVRTRAFERGTVAALERLRARSGDLFLLPNPWLPELLGLATALGQYRGLAGASIHVLMRREFRQGEMSQLREAIRALADRAASNQVFFHTDTPELTQLYTSAFGVTFQTLPIPHPITDFAARAPGEPIQICYVGDARCEKGFASLPEIIGRVLGTPRGVPKVRFVIQANSPSTGLEPDAREALRLLEGFDPSAVTLITRTQDRSEYETTILSSNIVLLPYKADRYRYRSSGVLIEALSAGVPVLVPQGTWLANELQRFREAEHQSRGITDGLAGVSYSSDAEAAERLIHLLSHLDDFQHVARECAVHVREQHNAERLVDALSQRAGFEVQAAKEESPSRNSRHAG